MHKRKLRENNYSKSGSLFYTFIHERFNSNFKFDRF